MSPTVKQHKYSPSLLSVSVLQGASGKASLLMLF